MQNIKSKNIKAGDHVVILGGQIGTVLPGCHFDIELTNGKTEIHHENFLLKLEPCEFGFNEKVLIFMDEETTIGNFFRKVDNFGIVIVNYEDGPTQIWAKLSQIKSVSKIWEIIIKSSQSNDVNTAAPIG